MDLTLKEWRHPGNTLKLLYRLYHFLIYFILNSRVEEYVNKEFDGTGVKIEVFKGQTLFEKMYPCLAGNKTYIFVKTTTAL